MSSQWLYASKINKTWFYHVKCRRSWAAWGHHRGQKGDRVFLLCPAKLPNETCSATSPVSVPDRHRPTSPNQPPIDTLHLEVQTVLTWGPLILRLNLSTCSICPRVPRAIHQIFACSLHDRSAGFPIHPSLLSLWHPPSAMLVIVLELESLPPMGFYLDAQLS